MVLCLPFTHPFIIVTFRYHLLLIASHNYIQFDLLDLTSSIEFLGIASLNSFSCNIGLKRNPTFLLFFTFMSVSAQNIVHSTKIRNASFIRP